jgi:hypothetical protein
MNRPENLISKDHRCGHLMVGYGKHAGTCGYDATTFTSHAGGLETHLVTWCPVHGLTYADVSTHVHPDILHHQTYLANIFADYGKKLFEEGR